MTTIILSGGKSRRMGKNKALLPLGEKRIIDFLIDQFRPVSQEIMAIANQPHLYQNIPIPVITDVKEFEGDGPLAGIYTGFEAAASNVCLFIACDMPFASPRIGEYLVKELIRTDYDAFIPSNDGKLHPLFGAYHTRIQPIVKDKLVNGQRKVLHLLEEVNVKIIEKKDLPTRLQNEWEYSLWNMNTMEDYEKTIEMFKERDHS